MASTFPSDVLARRKSSAKALVVIAIFWFLVTASSIRWSDLFSPTPSNPLTLTALTIDLAVVFVLLLMAALLYSGFAVERFDWLVWAVGGVATLVCFAAFVLFSMGVFEVPFEMFQISLSLMLLLGALTAGVGIALSTIKTPATPTGIQSSVPLVKSAKQIKNYFESLAAIFMGGIVLVCLIFLVMGGFHLYVFNAMLFPVVGMVVVFTIVTARDLCLHALFSTTPFGDSSPARKIVAWTSIVFYSLVMLGAAIVGVLAGSLAVAFGAAIVGGIYIVAGIRMLLLK